MQQRGINGECGKTHLWLEKMLKLLFFVRLHCDLTRMSWYTPTPTHRQNIIDSRDIHFTFKFDDTNASEKEKKKTH